MTRYSVARAVQSGVTEQMQNIQGLAREIDALYKDAQRRGDRDMLAKANLMAEQLSRISRKAYEVGAVVLDNVAA